LKKHNATLAVGIIVGLLCIGFFRDFLFVHINEHLYCLRHGIENNYLPKTMYFLQHFSYMPLYISKFFLTLLFYALYILSGYIYIKKAFPEKENIRIWFILNIGLGLIAAVFFTFGYVFSAMESGYRLSRFFMGLVQSPVPLMIVIPFLFYNEKIKAS
jgi:hypothetical protein